MRYRRYRQPLIGVLVVAVDELKGQIEVVDALLYCRGQCRRGDGRCDRRLDRRRLIAAASAVVRAVDRTGARLAARCAAAVCVSTTAAAQD